MRLYKKTTVYEETLKRIRFLYDEFDEIVVSISGGKDSDVVFHCTLTVAKERNRLPLKVMWQDSPHWIGTRRGTPLHRDELYPRYTHQLKVRVDDGIYARGLNKEEIKLERGLFYILDTHSPHQVFRKKEDAYWNISVSIDSYDLLPVDETIRRCINYGFNNSVW